MIFRCSLIFLAICSFITSSDGKEKLAECKEDIYNKRFSYPYNRFAWHLWWATITTIPDGENVILYPYNYLRLFAIIYGGASDSTRKEFDKKLQISYENLLKYIDRYEGCFKTQKFDKEFKVKEMGYYGDNISHSMKVEFSLTIASKFGTEFLASPSHPNPELVKKALNEQGMNITDKLIETFFDDSTGSTYLYPTYLYFPVVTTGLDEVLFFGGHHGDIKWRRAFNKKDTKTGDFIVYPPKNQKVKAQIITAKRRYPRSGQRFVDAVDYVEVLLKPKRFSIYFIVPSGRKSFKSAIKSLKDYGVWNMMQQKENKEVVTLHFPKFKINDKSLYDFTPSMKHEWVGLNTLTDRNTSSLTRMSSLPLYVRSIQQSTYFELDEDKAKSAALINFLVMSKDATKPTPNKEKGNEGESKDNSEGSDKKTPYQRPSFVVSATKPCMFAIVDREAQIPLVFGKISKPKYE